MTHRAGAARAARGAAMRLTRYGMTNVVRSRWLLCYALFFMLATDALLRFSGAQPGALLSLANIVLLVIPLISMVFGTIYVYDAREFTELLLAQPIGRRRIFFGLYLGLVLPLIAGFVVVLCVLFTIHVGGTPEILSTLPTKISSG